MTFTALHPSCALGLHTLLSLNKNGLCWVPVQVTERLNNIFFARVFCCSSRNPPADSSAPVGFWVMWASTHSHWDPLPPPCAQIPLYLFFICPSQTRLCLTECPRQWTPLATPLPKCFLLQFKESSLGVTAPLGFMVITVVTTSHWNLVYLIPPCTTRPRFLFLSCPYYKWLCTGESPCCWMT